MIFDRALTVWLLLALMACGGAEAAPVIAVPTSDATRDATNDPTSASSADFIVPRLRLQPTASAARAEEVDESATKKTPARDDIMNLPPLTDETLAASDKRRKVAKKAVRYEVVKVSGPLGASDFDFSLEWLRVDLAECVSNESEAVEGVVVVDLAYDANGAPQSATLSKSSLPAATGPCLQKLLAKVDPVSHTQYTSEKQANQRATIKLTFDVPAGF